MNHQNCSSGRKYSRHLAGGNCTCILFKLLTFFWSKKRVCFGKIVVKCFVPRIWIETTGYFSPTYSNLESLSSRLLCSFYLSLKNLIFYFLGSRGDSYTRGDPEGKWSHDMFTGMSSLFYQVLRIRFKITRHRILLLTRIQFLPETSQIRPD